MTPDKTSIRHALPTAPQDPSDDAATLVARGVAAADALSADSEKFLAAWRSWRRGALLPRRRDMDLLSICGLMPRLMLLDVHGPDRAVFRLAGTEIERQVGVRFTGRDYVAMAPVETRRKRGGLLWQVVSQPCAAINIYDMRAADGSLRQVQVCSTPIQPDDDAAPMQLLAVASNLPPIPWGHKVAPHHGIATRLRFIDIGAGLPRL